MRRSRSPEKSTTTKTRYNPLESNFDITYRMMQFVRPFTNKNPKIPRHFLFAHVCQNWREVVVDYCAAVKPLSRLKCVNSDNSDDEYDYEDHDEDDYDDYDYFECDQSCPKLDQLLYDLVRTKNSNISWMLASCTRAGASVQPDNETELELFSNLQKQHPNDPVITSCKVFSGGPDDNNYVDNDENFSLLVSAFPNLQSLELWYFEQLSAPSLQLLPRYSSTLRKLWLIGYHDHHVQVPNLTLTVIEKLVKLEDLCLNYLHFTSDDSGFQNLSSCTNLQIFLVLNCTGLSDSSMTVISNFTALRELRLSNLELSNDAFSHVAENIRELVSLDLKGDWVDDETVELIGRNLTKLKILNLCGCKNITNVGPLTSLQSLTTLRLYYCKKVTSEGLFKLTNLPKLYKVKCSLNDRFEFREFIQQLKLERYDRQTQRRLLRDDVDWALETTRDAAVDPWYGGTPAYEVAIYEEAKRRLTIAIKWERQRRAISTRKELRNEKLADRKESIKQKANIVKGLPLLLYERSGYCARLAATNKPPDDFRNRMNDECERDLRDALKLTRNRFLSAHFDLIDILCWKPEFENARLALKELKTAFSRKAFQKDLELFDVLEEEIMKTIKKAKRLIKRRENQFWYHLGSDEEEEEEDDDDDDDDDDGEEEKVEAEEAEEEEEEEEEEGCRED
jgi:hypothetical protein